MLPSLPQLLTLATDAALAAGALLREEFHRDGGPRSLHSQHAEVDTEAERLIRGRLLSAGPEFSYLGEELGAHGAPAAPGRPLWIVDPNDGTSDFLKGFRGAAVSIGLLLNGDPVLGVVYAPNAPDDDGDLFCAMQGEPATRNGRALPPLQPVTPGPLSVVHCAMSADRAPEAAAKVFAPCRFRGVPSVAYRFALLAAGEADFALSHGGTNYWDFAGVHAILRSAGVELYNEAGTAVRYPVDGRGRCGRSLFAAHPDFFQAYFHPGLLSSWKPVQPRPPRIRRVREGGLLRRAQGCLLGALATNDPGPLGRGAEQALTLARGIADRVGYDSEAMLGIYRRWAYTTWQGSREPVTAASQESEGANSMPGETLARIAPLAVFAAGADPERAAAWAAQDAALTDPNPVSIAATAILADAMAHAIASGSSPLEVYRRALQMGAALGVPAPLFDALQRAEDERLPAHHAPVDGPVAALQSAFHRLLAHAPPEGILEEAAMHGAGGRVQIAVCGALAGAVFGREAIPLSWRRLLLTARNSQRPAWLWPADALTLAESLLAAGAGK